LVGAITLLPKILGQPATVGAKPPIFNPYLLVTPQPHSFIGLTIHAKMISGGDPLYLKFWVKLTALERSRRFSIYFRL